MGAYTRLTKADRKAIESSLFKRQGCREAARAIGRSPSTVSEEVRRNRTWMMRGRRGERVEAVPADNGCGRLERWPWTCNGCAAYPRACGRKWRCEYGAVRAQSLADDELSSARRGINAREEDFERIAFRIRDDIGRGLSPEQVCMRHADLGLAPSTLYRWIERGYFGMSNMDLRRKVGYKPRKERAASGATAHGEGRSYAAFCALPAERTERACEMDTVLGRKADRQCLLTLYMRPCRAQLALLLPERSSSAVAAALDMLEGAVGAEVFGRLFGLVLTDNGAEFADPGAIEASALSASARCEVYYCDVRATNQKSRCERAHVELRKILPKRRGISFDGLDARDCAALMSHANSEPRPSLMGLSPLAMLRAADPEAFEAVTAALGIEEVPYGRLDMTPGAIDAARAERGLPPLLG